MENLFQRIFSTTFRHSPASRVCSTLDSSREHLLSAESTEKDYPKGDDSETEDHASLPGLAEQLILQISSLLDEASRLCLKNTNVRFRNLIEIDETRVSQCARWKTLTYLERDLLDKGHRIPDRLACIYCKRAHPRKDFGVRNGNAGYGIESLCVVETSIPEGRHCWRFLPRLFDYAAHIETPEVDSHNRKPPGDMWCVEERVVCCHCCGRASRDEKGKLSCQTCNQQCDICGYVNIVHYERRGPPRPLETYANIRFVRYRETRYRLAIRDLNGIRDHRRAPPKEPRILRERCRFSELLQQFRALDCLVDPRIEQNPFFLYSPVLSNGPGSRGNWVPPDQVSSGQSGFVFPAVWFETDATDIQSARMY